MHDFKEIGKFVYAVKCLTLYKYKPAKHYRELRRGNVTVRINIVFVFVFYLIDW